MGLRYLRYGIWGLVGLGLWARPASAESPSKPVTYRVMPSESLVYVRLAPNESSLLSGLSHEHVIRAEKLIGKVTWTSSTAQCAVRIDVPVEGLVVDDPALRKKLSIKKDLSESDRETIAEHMRDEDQLHAAHFPRIRFRSQSCKRDGQEIEVKGDIQIRGKKKTIAVKMTVEFSQDRFRARGGFSVTHADFGFEPYSALLGTIKNGEALAFTVDIVARVPVAR